MQQYCFLLQPENGIAIAKTQNRRLGEAVDCILFIRFNSVKKNRGEMAVNGYGIPL